MSTPWGQQPPPRQRPDRPWWKKKRFNIPLGVLTAIVVIAVVSPSEDPEVTVADPPAATAAVATTNDPAALESTELPEPTVEKTQAPKPKKTRAVTSGEENALAKAEDYLDVTAFSRKGLIEQLKFDDFTTSEAIYAVDHVAVNWNSQAARKAKQYLDVTSFSRSGLIEQLEFDGFTSSQAKHGVKVAY